MAEGELHRHLVQHIVVVMRARGLAIVSVDARGSHRPEEVRRWPWQELWFRPDVVARYGRRRIYGDAKRNARDVQACVGQLVVLAAMSSEMVICVPDAELASTAHVLDDSWGLRSYRRLRLLGDRSLAWWRVDELL